MPNPLSTVNTRVTPQREKARADQSENHAGGFVFTVDARTRARRFLTIGVESNQYYVGANKLAAENAQGLIALAADSAEGRWLVDEIVAISDAGRAPRNDEALFALAVCAASPLPDIRTAAMLALPKVARTGTHLFLFAGFVEQFRGWGPALRKGVAAWYTDQSIQRLENQVVKYRQREGWTHRDMLRLSHPRAVSGQRKDLFDWVCGREVEKGGLPLVDAFTEAQTASNDRIREMIGTGIGLTWEMLPDTAVTDPDVWRALISAGMPLGALIRQLPRLTRLGVLQGNYQSEVISQITSTSELQRSRIHPFKVLTAHVTYGNGTGRGGSVWSPNAEILDALDAAFYGAFRNVTPTGKRTRLALDVSGSMWWGSSHTKEGLPSAMVAAAMALVTKAVEGPNASTVAFSDEMKAVPLSARQRLDDVMRMTERLSQMAFRTNCSLPMVNAAENREEIDTFVIYTDNETYAGRIHPHQALRAYREQSGINAKLIVVATSATEFSVADPKDGGMLDVVGFDSATPELISGFSRGEF